MVTESNTPDTFDASSRQMSAGTCFDVRAPGGVSSSLVKQLDRPLHRAHDVAERDRLGRARQEVAALGPALGVDDVGAPQLLEDLLEVAQRHLLASRDVARLRRSARRCDRRCRTPPALRIAFSSTASFLT